MSKLQEGIDYYIENGYYVFTALYLKNRGYCCSNGCRHCPYPLVDKGNLEKGLKTTDNQSKNRQEPEKV